MGFFSSFLIKEWKPLVLGSFCAVIKYAVSERGHWKAIQISTSTIANFMPPCTPMILFIKVLLNVSCCRKDQKCYITYYISPKCGLYFYFFRTAIRPEKVCIVIDTTTFPILKNSQALQEAANSWCALPAILLNEPFSYMLSFNNTKL